jgi:hypothetical protein
METAARRFETAGNSVAGVFDKSAGVADQLTSSATSLQAAALVSTTKLFDGGGADLGHVI